jgi:WD repeat-containing protein 19
MVKPVLAVGTEKGSVVFFNRKTNRKIPTVSKHGKKVTGGDWNQEGNLITCSDDKLLTVSNMQGDTLHESFICKGEILSVKWCPYRDAAKPKKVCASIIAGKQICYLKPEAQDHFMFSFHNSFGKALIFEWFGDNKLVIGFNSGMISLVSTKS